MLKSAYRLVGRLNHNNRHRLVSSVVGTMAKGAAGVCVKQRERARAPMRRAQHAQRNAVCVESSKRCLLSAKPTSSSNHHHLGTAGAPQTQLSVDPQRYPSVRRDESVVETLHGVEVADPYRWLEDPDAPETQAFVEAQNKLTAEVLAECDTRDRFKQLFTDLYNYPKFGTPFKKGARYFYYHNSGLQQQFVLYTQPALGADATVLLDPNALSDDGTVALRDAAFSDDGELMAYQVWGAWAWIVGGGVFLFLLFCI
jgi:hypothetical protein